MPRIQNPKKNQGKKVVKSLQKTKLTKKAVNLPQVAKTKTSALKQKFTTGYYHCLANN
jgi:hypothetical protein